jgi:hypothetical protein
MHFPTLRFPRVAPPLQCTLNLRRAIDAMPLDR